MQRSTSRILTTHVGSLVRPPSISELTEKSRTELADSPEFEARLGTAVREVVREQVDAGLDIINDGEYGKSSWHRYILTRLTGFEQLPAPPTGMSGKDRRDFPEFYAQPNMGLVNLRPFVWGVTGPVAYRGRAEIAGDIARLKAAAAGLPVEDLFMAAVAPASVAAGYKSVHYASDEECLFAIADAMREEYKAIVDAGLILQLDDAYLAVMYDLMVPPATLADYRRWVEVRIEALNRSIAGLPIERTRYHMCWGAWNGPHASDVELKRIVDLLLTLNVGGFAFEMANPRHEHEWRVWETAKLPAGRVLIPGVVTHSTHVVEHPELVAERIVRLAKLVGRENVIAGTDCGFAQVAGIQRTHPSVMWAKLKSLTEGARLASRELWGVRAPA